MRYSSEGLRPKEKSAATDRLYSKAHLPRIEQVPEFPHFGDLTPEVIMAIMVQTNARDLQRLILAWKQVGNLWTTYRRSLFIEMQAVQFPEFHGVFGEMPLFDDQGRGRAKSNATWKRSPKTRKKGSQGPNKVQPAEDDDDRNTGQTKTMAPKQGKSQALQPWHTVNVSDSGADVQIPVRGSIRTPRQDRHIKEVAFSYEMQIGPTRIRGWEHYGWLRHKDGWNFLEFLAGARSNLDQHLHELNPLWTANVETRIAMLTLDRMYWRERSLGNVRLDNSYSEREERLRDQVEIFHEQTASIRTLVLQILRLLVQGIEDPHYLHVRYLVGAVVADYAIARDNGKPHMLDHKRSIETFWRITTGYILRSIFAYGVMAMVRQLKTGGCSPQPRDRSNIKITMCVSLGHAVYNRLVADVEGSEYYCQVVGEGLRLAEGIGYTIKERGL